MKTSSKIVSIGANNGMVSRASANLVGKKGTDHSIHKFYGDIEGADNNQTASLRLVAFTMNQLIEQGFKGKRVSFVVPDSIARRCFQAFTIAKDATAPEDFEEMVLDWMVDEDTHPEYFFDLEGSEEEMGNIWYRAIGELADAMLSAKKARISVNFVGRHELYRWEIFTGKDGKKSTYDGLEDGQKVSFTKGVGEIELEDGSKLKVQSENNMLNGDFTVERRGQAYYVERRLSRDENNKLVGDSAKACYFAKKVDEAMLSALPSLEDFEEMDIDVVDDVESAEGTEDSIGDVEEMAG